MIEDTSFHLRLDGQLCIDCPDYAVAVNLWERHQQIAQSLKLFPHVYFVSIYVKGSPLFPAVTVHPSEIVMQSITEASLDRAYELKASLFLVDYDGTYIEYCEAGHAGQTIVPYEEMIGTKAMDKLPEPMRTVVKSNHDRAIQTGEPQEYIYTSPATGKEMRSLVVPYPVLSRVVIFVMDAPAVTIPA